MRIHPIAAIVASIASCFVQRIDSYTVNSKTHDLGSSSSSIRKHSGPFLSRRQLAQVACNAAVAVVPVATLASPRPEPAFALDSSGSFSRYNDELHGFSIQVPASWNYSTRTLPDRRKISLWTDPDDASGQTLLFVAYTPVRDDFTSLSSFGSVEQVASQTILPKGQLAGVDVSSELLSATSRNQAYYFDYTQAVPGVQPLTHLRAIFALQQGATGGAGAVLVTVTAQAPEERYSLKKDLFDRIVDSYGKAEATAAPRTSVA